MMTYINMQPRPDNDFINSSPTSDIPPITYIPAGVSLTTSIDISMSDADGDDIECRFAKASHSLGGITVNECSGACNTLALPGSTQLISGNNTCTLIVSLPTIGYYAVAIQLEDFIENTTTPLSSVPLQFLLLAYDASNPTSTCTLIPIITSIPPDLPLPGGTVALQVSVLYTAMVIAQTGCANDTDTSIANFITTSPPGMLKTNLPFTLASPSYAINLTWTPTIAQLGQTFTFCAIAVDSNYYSSNQYCFNLFVGPKTSTTSTTSTTSSTTSTTSTTTSSTTTSTTSTTTSSVTTTSTTSTTTTVTQYNYIPLALGLGLGLGLPLLLLLSLLSLCYLCRWCPGPLRTILRYRYRHRDDMYCQHCQRSILFDDPEKKTVSNNKIPDGTRRYRQQYLNNHEDQSSTRPTTLHLERESTISGSMGMTKTSLLSPSTMSLPMESVSRIASPLVPPGHSYTIIALFSYELIRNKFSQCDHQDNCQHE